jgi:hypothetical protein
MKLKINIINNENYNPQSFERNLKKSLEEVNYGVTFLSSKNVKKDYGLMKLDIVEVQVEIDISNGDYRMAMGSIFEVANDMSLKLFGIDIL